MAWGFSMGWLRAAALVLGARHAAGVRQDAGSETNQLDHLLGNQAARTDTYACFCKKVDSMSDCPDNKHANDPLKPSGPRFFHADVPGEEGTSNLCCKALVDGVLSFAGFAYTKQKDFERCTVDVRPVDDATKCCRLVDRRGSMGVHVRSVQSRAVHQQNRDGWTRFTKTPPEFRLEDIHAAADYDGGSVPVESAQQLVQHALENGRFQGKPYCGGAAGSMELFFKDGKDDGSCRLREAATRECCCNEVTLEVVERCLPVENAATEEEAATRDLKSEITSKEYDYGLVFDDTATKSGPPHDESRMPRRLEEIPDPEQKDLPETASTDEASIKFNWDRVSGQWSSDCAEPGKVRRVIATPQKATYQDGQTCKYVHINRARVKRCKPKLVTEKWTDYSQGWKEACLAWRWQRRCPAGQGLYMRRIKPGECMGEGTGLEQASPDSLVYRCPAGHGMAGVARGCRCEQECS